MEFLKRLMERFCPSCKEYKEQLESLEDAASSVYYEITGGRMSRVNYPADVVIKASEDYNDKLYSDIYKSDIEDILAKYRTCRGHIDSSVILEDLMEDLEAYLEIDADFIESRTISRENHRKLNKLFQQEYKNIRWSHE